MIPALFQMLTKWMGIWLSAAVLVVAYSIVASPVAEAAEWSEKKHMPSVDNTLIVFGGIGYAEEDTQNALYEILIAERDGDPGYFPIGEALDGLVKDAGGFPSLSAHPVSLYRSDAEAAIKTLSGQATLQRYAIADLDQYFNQIFGLIFIGSYEDQYSVSRPDPMNEGVTLYSDYFTTGVSAILFDLKTGEIVLSASAVKSTKNKIQTSPVSALSEKRSMFAESYRAAAGAAFSRLQQLAAKTNTRALSDRFKRHIVTGFWISTPGAREVFEWEKPEPATDSCSLPSGCKPGSRKCAQVSSLLVHGLTSTLSEAGFATLPPLNFSDWREDNAYEVGVRLHLPQDRDSLIGKVRRFSMHPRMAEVKHIARLDYVAREERVDGNGLTVSDEYYAGLSRMEAETEKESCEIFEAPKHIRDDDFYGDIAFTRHISQERPSSQEEEDIYKFAILEALPKLGKSKRRR